MKRSSRMISMTLIASLAAIAAPLPTTIAQPERGLAQTRPGGDASGQTMGNPAERLRKRLETIDAERAKLSDALKRLDAGESWDKVRADLSELGRPGGRGGDRGNSGPRDRGDKSRPRMDEARIIELLSEVDPEAVDRFKQLRERNPRMAGRLLQSKGPRLAKIVRLKESQPDLFEIEAEQFRIEGRIMHAARAMHKAIAGVDDPDSPEINISIDETRQRLRELIARQVDLQIDGQRLQLESAKDRIDRLTATIDERIASRDTVIEERVERIMNRAVRGGVNRRLQDGGGDKPRNRDHRPGRDRPGPSQRGPDRP